MAFRNSVLRTNTFAATGGGTTILERLYGGVGPALNYVVSVDLIEVTAGAGSLEVNGVSIDIPAAVPVGTHHSFSFGDGLRLTNSDVVLVGAGTRSGTITYYVGP